MSLLNIRRAFATGPRFRALHVSCILLRQVVYQYKDIEKVSKALPTSKFLIGSIPSSTNISVKSLEEALSLEERAFKGKFGIAKPAKDADEVIFYCRSGVRSTAAADIAEKLGYKQIGNYKGSWLDWSSKSEMGSKHDAASQLQPGPDGKIQGLGEGAAGGIDLKAMNQREHQRGQQQAPTPLKEAGERSESESVKNGAEMKDSPKFQ